MLDAKKSPTLSTVLICAAIGMEIFKSASFITDLKLEEEMANLLLHLSET